MTIIKNGTEVSINRANLDAELAKELMHDYVRQSRYLIILTVSHILSIVGGLMTVFVLLWQERFEEFIGKATAELLFGIIIGTVPMLVSAIHFRQSQLRKKLELLKELKASKSSSSGWEEFE